MNCNNLTPSEAIDLYYSSLPIDLEKRILEIRRGTFFVNDYRDDGYDSYIKGQFRGFLRGGGWVIYIGDETHIYWSISKNITDRYWPLRDYTDWQHWNDDLNHWGGGHIVDITDLICKGWKGQFINWRTDPFEVKS